MKTPQGFTPLAGIVAPKYFNQLGKSETRVALRIREGQALTRAGEQSGNPGAMMERTADCHDEETGRWIEHGQPTLPPGEG